MMRKVYDWLKTAALWIALTAMVLGGSSQIWNVVQERQLDSVVSQIEDDRVKADILSCESGNRLRASIRDFARDLNADAETIVTVDARFVDRDCTKIIGYDEVNKE